MSSSKIDSTIAMASSPMLEGRRQKPSNWIPLDHATEDAACSQLSMTASSSSLIGRQRSNQGKPSSKWISLVADAADGKEDASPSTDVSSSSNKRISGIQNGWFSETEALWPGQKFSLALEGFAQSPDSILFSAESDFQSVLVFKSAQYGNVLVLDGVIQMTARDEFAFHEMMVHLPLCSINTTKDDGVNVLIVGGGDGGVLREVVTQYDKTFVRSITVVEIDPVVIQVAKEYFHAAPYFDDERVTVVHADAATFLADRATVAGKYQVVIADTSDPVGPAEPLFQPAFYENMYTALSSPGIVCVQAECFWIHLDLISDLIACCRDIFDTAEYATTMVPTYPCGQIGFILARKGGNNAASSCRVPIRKPANMHHKLKWYSPEIHRAAFVLPPFVAKRLDDDDEDDNAGIDVTYPELVNGGVDSRTLENDDNDEEQDNETNKCFFNSLPPWASSAFRKVDDDDDPLAADPNGQNSDQERDCFAPIREQFQCTIL